MHPPVDSPLCSTTTGCHHRPWVIPRPAARPFVLWRELETRQTCPQGTLHFLSQYCRLSPCKPLSRRRKGKEVYSPSSSPLLSSPHDSATGLEEKHLAMFAILPPVPTRERQGQRIYSKPCPPQHLVPFFPLPRFFHRRSKTQKPFEAPSLFYSCMRLRVKAIHVCLCVWFFLCAVRAEYTQFDCSLCMTWGRCGGVGWGGTENVRWGGLDVAFQSEWPAEENNKARMTGTDGPLYCPLKCKHWISLLGGWRYYIFIFSLLSLSLLIALVAGTHPHLRLKGLIKGLEPDAYYWLLEI